MGRYMEKLAKTKPSKATLEAIAPFLVGAGLTAGAVYGGKKVHEAGHRRGFVRGVKAESTASTLRRGIRAEEMLRRVAARRMAQRRLNQGK